MYAGHVVLRLRSRICLSGELLQRTVIQLRKYFAKFVACTQSIWPRASWTVLNRILTKSGMRMKWDLTRKDSGITSSRLPRTREFSGRQQGKRLPSGLPHGFGQERIANASFHQQLFTRKPNSRNFTPLDFRRIGSSMPHRRATRVGRAS